MAVNKMREILYKNLTGINNMKRDLCLREVITQDNLVTVIERRCIYYVLDRVYIEDPANLAVLESVKKNRESWKKRHFHILRSHDVNTGEDRLFCKVAGTLYAVVEHYLFCIAFIQSFKIRLVALPLSKS